MFHDVSTPYVVSNSRCRNSKLVKVLSIGDCRLQDSCITQLHSSLPTPSSRLQEHQRKGLKRWQEPKDGGRSMKCCLLEMRWLR
ncbi:hypothetical protein LEMLEM_LOCUS12494 [Lemmus lemmus]